VQKTYRPFLELNLGKHLQMKIRHTLTELDAEGANVFTANLTDARLTYQFDTKQFLRFTAVHADIDRNQSNYLDEVDANNRDLSMQLLYSYKVNPLTKFFIGYSEAGFSDDTFRQMMETDRSLFMKFSYAWQQ